MIVQLVKVQTSDGVRLDGALNQANSQAARNLVICLHGVGSNFYGSRMMSELALAIADWNADCLRVNTRGHDYCYTGMSRMGVRRLGAGYERVEQCLEDIDAWLDWADQQYEQVILLGHSLGAIKAVYYQVNRVQATLSRVIAVSPPRLSYRAFLAGERSGEFRVSIENARTAIEEGQPERLVDVTVPFPLLITAESYLDKYGPEEKYNIETFIDQLTIPTDFVFGGHELEYSGIAFAALDRSVEELAAEAGKSDVVTVQVVANADHMYSQHAAPLATLLEPLIR